MSISYGEDTLFNAKHTDNPTRFTSALVFHDSSIAFNFRNRSFGRDEDKLLATIRKRYHFPSPYWVPPAFAKALLGADLPARALVIDLGCDAKVVNAADTHDAHAFHRVAAELELLPTFFPSFTYPRDMTDVLKLRKLGCTSDIWVNVQDLPTFGLSIAEDAPGVEVDLLTPQAQTADPESGCELLTESDSLPTNVYVNGDFILEKDMLQALTSYIPLSHRNRPFYGRLRALLAAKAHARGYTSTKWITQKVMESYSLRLKDEAQRDEAVVQNSSVRFFNAEEVDNFSEEVASSIFYSEANLRVGRSFKETKEAEKDLLHTNEGQYLKEL